jgi:molybdate transport system permease protein
MRRVPASAIVVGLVGAALVGVPLVGLLWRVPWAESIDVLRTSEARQALWLSLQTSVAATVLAATVGVPLAWVQARTAYPGQAVVRGLTTVPMVLPPVVGGVALLLALGRRGIAGDALGAVGIHLPFHLAGAVVAEAFVAMPFLVLTVESAIRGVDVRLEDAARTLGASPWRVFRTVTLPLARPGIVAGLVLCWARALGEFGATITFAGNLPGATRTLPLLVYVRLESGDTDAALVLSVLLLAVSLAVIVALRGRWRP